MIGLLFLIALVFWLFFAIKISQKVTGWLEMTWGITGVGLLVFPLVFVAPVADELIGRWQFSRLCDREAVTTLAPNWEKVKRAGERAIPSTPLTGYLIKITSQRAEYFDIDTGKNFFTNQAFHAYGGLLAYRLGLSLGGSTACWAPGWVQVSKKLNIDQLLKQGKTK